jgi:hypothetical protein
VSKASHLGGSPFLPPRPPFPPFDQGMDSASPVNKTWLPSLLGLWRGPAGPPSACNFVAQLSLDPATVSLYGGMAAIYLNVTLDPQPLASAVPTLLIDIRWLNKVCPHPGSSCAVLEPQ